MEIKFYTMNLTRGYAVEQKAIKNLRERYSEEQLEKVTNYDEIGIVEYVADGEYEIIDNKICPYYDEIFEEEEE